jgi:hypothetical protein
MKYLSVAKTINTIIIGCLFFTSSSCKKKSIYNIQFKNNSQFDILTMDVDLGGSKINVDIPSKQTSKVVALEKVGKEIVASINLNVAIKTYKDAGVVKTYSSGNIVPSNLLSTSAINSIDISYDSTVAFPNGVFVCKIQ